MTTPLDDIRLADDPALQVVWQFGGYETAFGPYPGRARALSTITGHDVLRTTEEPPVTVDVPTREDGPELYDVIHFALQIMWSLAHVATGYIPDRLPHRDLAFAPRTCRIACRHPFRSAVHCTAPPARRVRLGGLQDP